MRGRHAKSDEQSIMNMYTLIILIFMKKQSICVLAIVATCLMFSFTAALAHTEAAAGEITHMQEMALSNALLAKVESGVRTCASLSNDDFTLLGEYFMEAALGDIHEQTEAKFETVLPHDGMDDMHLLLGKYGVHCDSKTLGASATTGAGNNSMTLSTRDLIVKILLWIFALYGVWSLVKQLVAKKGGANSRLT